MSDTNSKDIEFTYIFFVNTANIEALNPALVDGDNVTFKNCVFENTAGKGCEVGQAIALYIDGDGLLLKTAFFEVIRTRYFSLHCLKKRSFPADLSDRSSLPSEKEGLYTSKIA